jgi:hypothetical protein
LEDIDLGSSLFSPELLLLSKDVAIVAVAVAVAASQRAWPFEIEYDGRKSFANV